MTRLISAITFVFTFLWGGIALAQSTFWIQLEANPTLTAAQTSARTYAGELDNVAGFRLGASGWYATAVGPYTEAEAATALRSLLATGTVPRDAYVSDGTAFGQQFWPVGTTNAAPAETETAAEETAPEAPVIEEPAYVPDETRAEALASERLLEREQREALQVALQFEGFYTSAIDGDFGPGTRGSMTAWQAAKGYDETGVLTTRQRTELLNDYRSVFDSLGLAEVTDEDAGISVVMPSGMVEFDRYEAPFAHYEGEDGVRVVLISQSGGQSTLYGLYDILQSLEVVPPAGERNRDSSSFTINGNNSQITSYTYATNVDGAVKGFMLVWPRGDDKRRDIALEAMRDSFASTGTTVLDDNAGLDEAMQSVDLVSGLEIRRADKARTGFYVTPQGAVLTTTDAVAGCSQITLDESYPASVTATDDALGLALITPETTLAPLAVASFATGTPRIQSDVAVAGFSFGGRLSSATLTFGKLADIKGLDDADNVLRLELEAQDGDAGGAVIDGTGSVLGLLQSDVTYAGRTFPDEVSFAAKADAITAFLTANGIEAASATGAMTMDPHPLAVKAADMSVLVSCWQD